MGVTQKLLSSLRREINRKKGAKRMETTVIEATTATTEDKLLELIKILLLRDPYELDDSEVAVILAAKQKIEGAIWKMGYRLHCIENYLEIYKRRKGELSKLSSEELRRMYDEERAAMSRRKVSDSGLGPSRYSDIILIPEILKERGSVAR